MQCPSCGATNPETAHFCGKCGAQIASAFRSTPGPVTSLGRNDKQDEVPLAAEPEISEPVLNYTEPAFRDPEPEPDSTSSHGQSNPSQPEDAGQPQRTGSVPAPPNPYAPGAGLVPPPGQTAQSATQQQMSKWATASGYSPQLMGNSSGMGEGYPVPQEAEGWSFGGFIPWGLFSFINGNATWGILWWVFNIFGIGIVYWIMVGLNGKKQAWQGRRFDSIEQFVGTMQAWNTWGVFCLIVNLVGIIAWAVIFAGMMATMMADPSVFNDPALRSF